MESINDPPRSALTCIHTKKAAQNPKNFLNNAGESRYLHFSSASTVLGYTIFQVLSMRKPGVADPILSIMDGRDRDCEWAGQYLDKFTNKCSVLPSRQFF
jgi:hypothetical protein